MRAKTERWGKLGLREEVEVRSCMVKEFRLNNMANEKMEGFSAGDSISVHKTVLVPLNTFNKIY